MGLCYLPDIGAARLLQNASKYPENQCIQIFSRMWDVVLFAAYILAIFIDCVIFVAFLVIPFAVAFLVTGFCMLGATCFSTPIDVMEKLSVGWGKATTWYVNLFRPAEPFYSDFGIECLLDISKMKRLPGTGIGITPSSSSDPAEAQQPLLEDPISNAA